MPLLSIVTGCFNEEDNVAELYQRVCKTLAEELPEYAFEMIFIDNASTDKTLEILRDIAHSDKQVKVIVNNRNFGIVRSAQYALLQAKGDAVIWLTSDLQDPPEMIPQFVQKWVSGFKVVLAQKLSSEESAIFYFVRSLYYRIVRRLSDIDVIEHATGFGLYDRQVVENIKQINDPYPWTRGLIADFGYKPALIPFSQPARKRGLSKMNFYSLWDVAVLSITNHSKIPLRLAIFTGFGIGILSFLLALLYFLYKLLFWQSFQLGIAPLVIGIFFLGAVQLIFIGILGEYIGSIHTQVLHRPLVIEKERINFD
jgi:glycosyltransferase involved in cell wall biosynthesis